MALVDDLLEFVDILVTEESEIFLHRSEHFENLEVDFDVLEQEQNLKGYVDDVDDELERGPVIAETFMGEEGGHAELEPLVGLGGGVVFVVVGQEEEDALDDLDGLGVEVEVGEAEVDAGIGEVEHLVDVGEEFESVVVVDLVLGVLMALPSALLTPQRYLVVRPRLPELLDDLLDVLEQFVALVVVEVVPVLVDVIQVRVDVLVLHVLVDLFSSIHYD